MNTVIIIGLVLFIVLPQLIYRRIANRAKYKTVRFKWEILSHSFIHFFSWANCPPKSINRKLHLELALLGVANVSAGILGWVFLLLLGILFVH